MSVEPSPGPNSYPRVARVATIIFGACALAGLAVTVHGLRMLGIDPAWGKMVLGIGLGATFLFAIPLFSRADLRINLAVSLVALVITVFFVNVFIAFKPPDNSLNEATDAARKADPSFDHRTVLDVVRDRNAEGKATVPALFPFYALEVHKEGGLLPLAGISTSTTVLCNELGPYSIYFSDEHGFNNPKGWPETADAVLIGDSFVHGQCVPPGADIAARLRARGWRVLNLGASGSGPLFELAVLSEYGLARKPKAVIWVYIGNDEGELLTEMLNPTLRRYLSGGFSQKLLERQQEIDTFWKGYLEEYVERSEAEKRRTDARPTVKTVNWREIFTMYPLRKALGLRRIQQGDRLQGVRTVLTRARDVSRGAGAELVLAIMPYWQIVKDHPGKGFEDVQAIGEELGIPVINFSPIFAEDPDPLRYFPYRLPGHFNEEGYEFVAKHLSERVMEKLAR